MLPYLTASSGVDIECSAFSLFEALSQGYLDETVQAMASLEPENFSKLRAKVYSSN